MLPSSESRHRFLERCWARWSQLYFAEDGPDRFIMRHGAAGAFVDRGRVLLQASGTDWSLFNNVSENAKPGSVVLYEQLLKPSGAALVESREGRGRIVLSTLDYRRAPRFWRTLLSHLGIALRAPRDQQLAAFDEQGALVNALSIGRFGASDSDAALNTDFVGSAAVRSHVKVGDHEWTSVTSPSQARFVFGQLQQAGPSALFVVYFSFRIKSPRALDDLLLAGPDVPRVTALCYVSRQCQVFLNDRELAPARTEPADYRTLLVFDGLPLKPGWNHVLIKVVSSQLAGDRPGTLAVRLQSSPSEFRQQLESATELPATGIP